jgi:hypothetical protein
MIVGKKAPVIYVVNKTISQKAGFPAPICTQQQQRGKSFH